MKTQSDPVLPHDHPRAAPGAAETGRLARLIASLASQDGFFGLSIPDAYVARVSHATPRAQHGTTQASAGLCIVAQGAKRVVLGQQVCEYDPSRMAIYSAEVPVTAHVVRASREEPYLGFILRLHPQRVAELALKVFPQGIPRPRDARAVFVGCSDASIVRAAVRLLELAAEPAMIDLVAPLIVDEMVIRLLRSPIGASVAQIGVAESSVHLVARAIAWMRENFAEPMKIDAMARLAHMSTSSFHQHFKAVTSMSPLQFQKTLRLQEARHLMLAAMMDASTASLKVGYSSASQFSREYSRFFGHPPATDIGRLRERGLPTRDATPAVGVGGPPP